MVPRKNAPKTGGVFSFGGKNKMNIVLEYILVFVGVFIFNLIINKFLAKGKDSLSYELLYLKKIYHIDIKSIDNNKLSRVIVLINTFIITTIYIILIYLLKSWLLRIVVGIVLLILMIIICYGLLGRYYAKERRR